jgi:hypothetical protein
MKKKTGLRAFGSSALWHRTNPKCVSEYWKMYGEATLESNGIGSCGIECGVWRAGMK